MKFIIGTLLLIAMVNYFVAAQDRPPVKQTTNIGPGDWKEFRSNEGQLLVSFPGTPQTGVDTVNTSTGPGKVYFLVLSVDQLLYYVSFNDTTESPRTPEEHRAALDANRDRAVAKRRLLSEKEITVDGVAGREVILEQNGLISRGRFFYAKNRLYHLIFSAPADVAFSTGIASANPADRTDLFEKSSTKFFDSFRFIKSTPGRVVVQGPPPPQVPPHSAGVEDFTTSSGKEFKSNEGRFTVVFPGDPMVEETIDDSDRGKLKTYSAIHVRTWGAFFVTYTDFPVGPETPAESKAALDGSRAELISSGYRLISESDVTIAGIAGREWLMEKGSVVVRVRAFFHKQRLYQLIFSSSAARSFRNGKASADPADRTELFERSSVRFFESFKLTK